MARVRELGPVLRDVGFVTFAKRVWVQLSEDQTFTWGAALAYSWLFAIFPFLIFLLSLVPLVPAQYKSQVQEGMTNFLEKQLPTEVTNILMTPVKGVLHKQRASGFLSFGLILTIWAASGGMNMTMAAIDKAYDVEKGRPFWKQRLLAIVLTIVVATLVILIMILMPVSSVVIKWLSVHGKIFGWILLLVDVARYALALILLFTVLCIIYYFAPSFKQPFVIFTPGAVFCVVVWLLLGAAFRLYLTKLGGAANYDKTYGAIAGAVILLLFFYLDALVLLVGAEINSEIDYALGRVPHRQVPQAGQDAQARQAPQAPATHP